MPIDLVESVFGIPESTLNVQGNHAINQGNHIHVGFPRKLLVVDWNVVS